MPFLPPGMALAGGAGSLTREQALAVRERCLRALKDRLIERANIIQVCCLYISVGVPGSWILGACVCYELVSAAVFAWITISRHEAVSVRWAVLMCLPLPRCSFMQARLDEQAALGRRQASYACDGDTLIDSDVPASLAAVLRRRVLMRSRQP